MINEYPIYWKSSEEMSEIADKSIKSVVTSPPYYNLKDYGHEEQIGTGDSSYEQFHTRLSSVWDECYKKLRDDGTMWIVADTTMDKDGDIRLIPHHISEYAEDIGFKHLETIVWYKPTSLAGMNPKILANKKEYILIFSKSKETKLDTDVKMDNGTEDPAISRQQDGLGDLWRFPVKRGSLGGNVLHKAPFPVDLAKRMIKISTSTGDQVLDPFLGSGTTAQAALELNRKICGYEINVEFRSVVDQRLC